ncbi:MAG: hypothetical protein KBG48_27465 [Kofleriaceae bacterium]|jgi:hypothetical protein|nr:hypothetical protein [Kofleriaceae bacterium]MBP9171169.1 hypothetical protein [Kofleriaceae bacterium]MBP9860431.1 hypothetical protein [Kofleriaceae bacterium]
MFRWVPVAALALAACSFTPTGQGDESCQARCDGPTAVTCPGGPDGEPVTMTCPALCIADPAPRCASVTLAPSNLTASQAMTAQEASGALVINADVTIDTSLMAFVEPGTNDVVTFAGVELVPLDAGRLLVAARTVSLAGGATLYGRGDRALILVAAETIDLAGDVDFRPGCAPPSVNDLRCGGPGGGDGGRVGLAATGCALGQAGSNGGGGAGGGNATQGGAGGVGTVAGAPPRGLEMCNAGGDLEPLHGGSGGGAGAGPGADGGGGGGALQLSAFGAIRIVGDGTAVLNLGGAGGQGADDDGGGGGGSGGALLIEAPMVTILDARLLAAGGGGGSGRQADDGQTARNDGTPAAGGASSSGGDGGGGASTAGVGGTGKDDTGGGGGGGGGLGPIRVLTANPSFTLDDSVVVRGVFTSGPINVR